MLARSDAIVHVQRSTRLSPYTQYVPTRQHQSELFRRHWPVPGPEASQAVKVEEVGIRPRRSDPSGISRLGHQHAMVLPRLPSDFRTCSAASGLYALHCSPWMKQPTRKRGWSSINILAVPTCKCVRVCVFSCLCVFSVPHQHSSHHARRPHHPSGGSTPPACLAHGKWGMAMALTGDESFQGRHATSGRQ